MSIDSQLNWEKELFSWIQLSPRTNQGNYSFFWMRAKHRGATAYLASFAYLLESFPETFHNFFQATVFAQFSRVT